MTMVPAENLYKQHLLHGSGFYGCWDYTTESFSLMSRVHGHGYDYNHNGGGSCLGSDPMAEDESIRTNSFNEAGSCSSKDNINLDDDQGWLQLSIGSRQATRYDHHQNNNNNKHDDQDQGGDPTVRRGGLMELDLLPAPADGGSLQLQLPLAPIFHMPDPPPRAAVMHNFSSNTTSLFFQHQQQGSSSSRTTSFPHGYGDIGDISWAFRPIPQNIAAASSCSSSCSSSSSSLAYFPIRPVFQVQSGIMDVAGPSSDFRIIDPPTRPYSGIWFMLQASQNQAKEPFLPQIPKSYLRIKDGKMTVRLLMKYLANKLRLDSESEIEIRCRGQELLPLLTLQHVRDQIWSSRDFVSLSSDTSSTTDHVMLLNYGRSAS